MPVEHLLLGSQIEAMTERSWLKLPSVTNVFAKLSPAHKERIIRALQSKGHVWDSWVTASTTLRR